MPILVIKILIALLADHWLGEPRRYHPLVGFGHFAAALEQRLNRHQRAYGLLAWALAIVPWVAITWVISQHLESWALWLWEVAILYLAIGRKSLYQHSRQVLQALQKEDLVAARQHTAMMVSRDCGQLSSEGCAKATIESVLENGNDSIFGALLWFVLLGAPGVVLYRLSNTLDAMWGYRTERFEQFGWAAAKIDDGLNYLPARLCAVSYALAGKAHLAFRSWQQDAAKLSSPNGGPVMCAGAGALDVELGGPASYHGTLIQKPEFGGAATVEIRHISVANQLVDRGLSVFLLMLLGLSWCLN